MGLVCRKCGAELHPEQKVCIACGERTAAGGKFDVEEDKPLWRPSGKQIGIASGVVGLVLIVWILYSILHVVPPEEVAKEWLDAMLSRQLRTAERLSSPELSTYLSTRMMDLRALSDQYVLDITGSGASYKVGVPTLDDPSRPTRADITITTTIPGGDPGRDVILRLIKVGRAWRVSEAS